MKRFIIGLIVLGLAVAAGFYFVRDPGTATVSLLGWELQTTALGLLVLMLVLFALLALLLRLVRGAFRLPEWLRRRSFKRRQNEANEQLLRAWAERQRGRISSAEKLALGSLEHASVPPMHYVVAIDALLDQHQTEKVEGLLTDVRRRFPRFADFLSLHVAKRLAHQGAHHKARELIQALHAAHPEDEAVTRAYAESLLGDQAWPELEALLPQLRRMNHMLLTETDLMRYERSLMIGQLTDAARQGDLDALSRRWAEAPRNLATDPEITLAYGRLLVKLEQGRAATDLAEKWLKSRFDSRIMRFWADLPHADVATAQARLDGFLGAHNNGDAESEAFCYARSRLLYLQEDYDAAQRELQPLLNGQPHITTLRLAAEIHARMRDSSMAARLYERALQRAETEDLGKP